MESTKLDCLLGGLGLLAAALVATGTFPVLSTLIAIVGIAAMIYELCGRNRSEPVRRRTAELSGSGWLARCRSRYSKRTPGSANG